MTSHNSLPELSGLQTAAQTQSQTQSLNQSLNQSLPEGCAEIRLKEWDYLPWDNPDNIMTLTDRVIVSKFRSTIVQVLCVIGGPANVINMAVFYSQSLKDRVNLLLFSLSLADALFITVAAAQYFEEFYLQFKGETKVGPVLLFFLNHNLFVFHGLCFVSFVLSAVIACDRCYCILRPLKYHALFRTRTMAVIIVAVYVVVLGLFFVVSFRYYMGCFYDPDFKAKLTLFYYNEVYKHNKDLIDYLDNVFFGAGLPTAMVIVVLISTILTVSKLRRVVAWRLESASSVSARDVALTNMLIGTSIFLIICASPACVFRVTCFFLTDMSTGLRYENFYISVMRISQIFVYVNSSFNIFIYYSMGSRYRETFWTLFKRKAEQTKT